MQHNVHGTRRRAPRSGNRFPGIKRDAALLGVNRASLWRLLTGRWQLKSLRERYDALKAAQRSREPKTMETHENP